MPAEEFSETTSAPAGEAERAGSKFGAADVAAIVRERGWLGTVEQEAPEAWLAWSERAAQLLGPQATNREELAALLELVFDYDVGTILAAAESHVVLSREGARQVVRELGREVLGAGDVDSDRLKEIVQRVVERTGWRGRELFHPLRLALAGRAGGGELDRVVLLLDPAARLPFAVAVKSVRQRMLEFCAALD